MTDEDLERLDALRSRLYRPDATEEDRAAYRRLQDAVAQPREQEGDGAPADDRVAPRRRLRRFALAGTIAVVLAGVAAAIAVFSTPASLGPVQGGAIRLERLAGASPVTSDALLSARDAAATARLFLDVPSTPAERTIARRWPFFGSGAGRVDFPLDGFDIGASTVSITVITDRDAKIEVDVASRNERHQLRTVAVARGSAAAGAPFSASARIDGLDDPSVLRVVAPLGTRFAVRAVFLIAIDRGSLDR